jgi:hypothetical protein
MHGSAIIHPELQSHNTLHVVGCVSNPVRFHSRYRLAREWLAHVSATPHVKAYLVETAFGDRHHEVATDAPNHLKLRSTSEAWTKESMLNLGVRHLLPRDWRYVAWVDADVTFRDPNWAQETMHQLQHWAVVQPWQQCLDLGPTGNVMQMHQSFGYMTSTGKKIQRWSGDPYPYGHSGFAWAATRGFWEQVGGLMDFCPLGSADHHMAWGMVGDCESTIHGKMSPGFFRRVREWQAKAVRATGKQVGFTNGRLEHFWHGAKKNRFYRERWEILVAHAFDPDTDLVHDAQGLIQLAGNKPGLEHDLRAYNRSRREDAVYDD